MEKIKAIIHDWDDVVTNSFEAFSQFYFDFGKYFGLKTPALEGIKKEWGKTIPQIAHGQWPELDEREIEKMVWRFIECENFKKHWELYKNRVKIFPGVVDAFKELSKNFKLAILSSGYRTVIEEIYKETIHPDMIYHQMIIAPPELKVHKPNPEVFNLILEQFKKQEISKEETVYVGDSLIDFYAAKNGGLEFYAVTTGLTSKEDFQLKGLRDNHIVKNFIDIIPLLESRNRF